MAVCAAGAPAAARTEGLGSSSLEKSAVSTKNGGSRLSDRLLTLSGQGFTRRSKAQQSAALGLPATGPGSLLRGPHGTVVVEARLDSAEEAVFQGLTAAGAKVTARADAERRVSMQVPISKLRDVANVPGVAWVGETLAPRVGKTVGDGPAGAIDPDGVGTRGSCSNRLITEGDTQLRAAQARSTYGVDGSGVTVGVLSDSYDTLGGAATDVSNGELPGVGNPCGRTNPVQIQAELNQTGTDEGRAMAQIVHDIAPGAGIRFATANNGEVDFANQIRALASAGAKVIVDDIYYFAEPVYQDGAVAKAVSDVSSQGVAYFSAAGNDNIILGGKNVASYEAMAYRPTSCPAAVGGV